MKKKLRWIPKTIVFLIAFLLPLKFGSIAMIPEMPMTYWTDPVAVLVASWPVLLFPFAAAAALALCILLLPMPRQIASGLTLYGWLWGLLTVVSLPGWLHSTTWDFAAQNTSHMLGILCWVLALIWVLAAEPDFARWLFAALIAGLAVSVYSAFNQYLTGFEDTLNYVRTKEAHSGFRILDGQFGNRLKEARVSADFALCNSYAGYLVQTFPLLIGTLWKLGTRVTPPLPAKLILTIPAAGVFLFLLKETGSRGGMLSLLAGGFLSLLCLHVGRKWKILFWSLLPVGLTGFWLLVRLGRGMNSMLIRFDYYQAAFRMMLLHPFTGAGWGEFLNDYLILKNVVNDEAPHSPHNFLLTLGAQCGIPAFVVSALILALPLIAALLLTEQKNGSESGSGSGYIPEKAFIWSIGSWTVHSMMELNYETPGSLGIAAAVSLLILSRWKLPASWKIPDTLSETKTGRLCFPVICVISAGAALSYLPGVIRAEMNYDALHAISDPRFLTRPQDIPHPAVIRDALAKCDPRSPFPFATASSCVQMQGQYYFPDALEMLDKAIELAPKRAAYYYRKYKLLQFFPGRKAEADSALRKARELSPKNPQYYPNGITPYGTRSY